MMQRKRGNEYSVSDMDKNVDINYNKVYTVIF